MLLNLLENGMVMIQLSIKVLNKSHHHGMNVLQFVLNENHQFMVQQYFDSSIELTLELKTESEQVDQMVSGIGQVKLYLNSFKHNELMTDTTNHTMKHSHDINVDKYMKQRFKLFSKFDQGIKLDTTSWYEVTPELIAQYIANQRVVKRRKYLIVIDGFTGCGGNMIQFLLQDHIDLVIGCDISQTKLDYTKENIKVYGCDESKMVLLHGDYMRHVHTGSFKHVIESFKRKHLIGDDELDVVAFLAPPYGTMNYTQLYSIYNLRSDLLINDDTVNGIDIYVETRKYLCPYIIYLLPKNVNINQVAYQLATDEEDDFEFEYVRIDNYLKLILMYSTEYKEFDQ